MHETEPMADPFVLGVNYWPRRKAMGWWSEFDAGEVREEFELIADLGLSVVRIFLLWEDFQPAEYEASPAALARLVTVCDIAAELGLRLDVTFFTGHMSGPNWAPSWLLEAGAPPPPGDRQVVSGGRVVASGYRDPYADARTLAAQRLLLGSVVTAVRDHPAIWIWNLGNEPDLFALPPDDRAGPAWARSLTSAVRALDGRHPVTCGLHVASLVADNGLRVDRIFGETDLAVMHAYPIYAAWAAGPLDADFVPFTCALTASLSGRPVIAEEFGACTAPPGKPSQTWTWPVAGGTRSQYMVAEDELADHLGQVLPRLVEVGALGALLWCFADYAPELWDRPPCRDMRHERFFGLVRPDGTLKPHAEVLRAFAATRPTVRPSPSYARLAVDADAFYEDPMAALPLLYERYRGDAVR
jgi:endo-1,4-beta-mannosidase